jgi:signal transduction histidine kinase
MADASAVALGGLLVAGDPQASAPAWTDLLAGDPPLALWVALQAQTAGAEPPGGIADLAHWFAAHVLEVLRWVPGSPAAFAGGVSRERAAGARVAAAVATAGLAARLAAPQGSETRDRAALLGLLWDAAGWLADCEPVPSDQPAVGPAWLMEARQGAASTAAAAALRAARAIEGTAPPSDAADIDVDLHRHQGDEARRRWLAAAGPAAEWLPGLVARLARLARLETRFEEAIETEKLEAMAEFAAGAGHEINNPLAVISGRAQLFLREESDPERRRALALISAQAMRIYEMIADMRLFARPPRPEPQRIELLALVGRLLGELRPWAEGQETALRLSGPAEPVEIMADPVQLTVALKAVVQNALEALGRGGHVELTIRRGQRQVEVSVSDDGPGIMPQERRHLFDPFYSARQAGRGLGMGLAKCWRIVAAHGGRIDVESAPGRGATLTIRLPLDGCPNS